jgi:multidrug efflux pump subunit AcrA (membrane-fusion protein)
MKNLIIGILTLGLVVASYVLVKDNFRPLRDKGELTRIIRGDLTLPISATGQIRPVREISIKSEASGEVVEIPFEGGTRVPEGTLLFRLDKAEEERNFERARADVNVSKARLEDAHIAKRLAEGPELSDARARVEQLQAQVDQAKFNKERTDGLEPHMKREDEIVLRDTALRSALAQLESAKAALERVELSIPRAQTMIEQAEAALEISKTVLADAERRLRKTDIVAPLDGILAAVSTQIGEVIQGGKFTNFGGTELGKFLDMSKVVVRAEVDEADIGRVLEITPEWAQPGHEISVVPPADFEAAAAAMPHLPKIRVEAFPDEQFSGIIERVFPLPRSISNVVTYQVDVVVVGGNRGKLLPGMRADVTFVSEHIEDVVLCPNEAIREGPSGKLGVMVPPTNPGDPEAVPVFVACEVGISNGSFSVIRSGVKEDDEVYIKLPRADTRKKN